MARRSLKPQLNQIRAWVRQGRTDAWIAHQLEISASELREFRKQHDLTPDGEDTTAEVDLRDEIEAEIEAATVEEAEEEEEADEAELDEGEDDDEDEDGEDEAEAAAAPKARRASGDKRTGRAGPERGDGARGEGDGGDRPRRRRRRGRRGGRGRRKELEATFDHGERDGYGLWLDASVKDNPVYAEHWAGKSDVTVAIEADRIVIRRAGEPAGDDGESNGS